MSFYANRLLVEQNMRGGNLEACQIAGCDISGLETDRGNWTEVEMRDVRANTMKFLSSRVAKCLFFRSDLVGLIFSSSLMSSTTLDGLTLIRSRWEKSLLADVTLRSACLQRAEFQNMKVYSSRFTDFEATLSRTENCLFANSRFVLTYGNGMNGWSEALVRGCVFYNCRFEGFPLRGAELENCVFVHCYGEIGDDMDCRNVVGLPGRTASRAARIARPERAANLIARFT